LNEPKPDESRLPTYAELVKEYGKRPADIAFNMAVKLTAKEARRMCQARVERIFTYGKEVCMEHGMRKRRKCDKCWQALEKQEGVK